MTDKRCHECSWATLEHTVEHLRADVAGVPNRPPITRAMKAIRLAVLVWLVLAVGFMLSGALLAWLGAVGVIVGLAGLYVTLDVRSFLRGCSHVG